MSSAASISDAEVYTPIEAKSAITKVTLYEQRAQVHRSAEINATDATNVEVIFDDIPANINRDTLQCNVFSFDDAPQVTLKGLVFDTKLKTNGEYDNLSEKQKAAVQRVDDIERELRKLRDALTVAKNDELFVAECYSTCVDPTSEQQAADYDLANWKKVVDARVAAREKALREQRSLERDIDALTKERDMQRAVASTTVWRTTSCNVLKVLLSSPKPPGKVSLELSYVIDQASWVAAYEMRVDSETGLIRIGYNAVVKQTSSEQWSDVTIELSTAKPMLSGKQPELSPWRLNIAPKFVTQSKRMFKRSTGALQKQSECLSRSADVECEGYDDNDDDESILDENIASMPTIQAADVDTAATSVTFKVPGRYTVANDGTETRVTIMQLEVESTLSYVTVPKEAEAAFAVAHAVNTSEFPLVGGQSNIFLDGHFVTKSVQPRTSPGESFDIGVGVDEKITVTYKKISRTVSDEGNILSGKKTMITFRFLVKISNFKKSAVKVLLKDQIPVSNDSTVVVARHEPAALPKGFPTESGMIELPVSVESGKTVEIPIHFDVTYPRGESTYGLN